jgi:uncharacterized membrane protein YfcA
MNETAKLFLLFGAGLISGIINVNAGGGSSLTLPALIFLGLEGPLANGTNRIGILIQNVFAIASFRHDKIHQFRKSLYLALFTLPGAVLGAILASRIDHDWFQKILGLVMIGIVFTMLFSRRKMTPLNLRVDEDESLWIYPAMFGIGFYGGFIQIGVGFLLMASLYHLLRVNLVQVNMHKVFIVFIYTLPALLVFILTKNVKWSYGIILAAGMALGAWWGAKIAIKGGERVIKIILAIAIFIMAIKLLGVY